jgi:hypothetical protein
MNSTVRGTIILFSDENKNARDSIRDKHDGLSNVIDDNLLQNAKLDESRI